MFCRVCKEEKPRDAFRRLMASRGEICSNCDKARIQQAQKISRWIVMKHYGGDPPRCACCDERQYEFLTMEHEDITAPGYKDNIGQRISGTKLIYWLIRNKFPKGFAVLCFNCNCAKGMFGVCPHKQRQ